MTIKRLNPILLALQPSYVHGNGSVGEILVRNIASLSRLLLTMDPSYNLNLIVKSNGSYESHYNSKKKSTKSKLTITFEELL